MSAAEKLLKAQQSVEAVVKKGFNKDKNYTYATAADVIAVCRQALHGARLVSAITNATTIERRAFTSSKGNSGLYVEARVTLLITDPDDKPLRFEATGAGADYGGGDKAVLKAQTAATKYAYANALALPFADHDPEKDVGGEPGRLPEQKADPEKALSDERVAEIGKAIKDSKVTFPGLCLLFGSVGANAPAIKRKDSIHKAVGELTENQAGELVRLLGEGGSKDG